MRRHKSPTVRTWPEDPDYVGGGVGVDLADDLAGRVDDALVGGVDNDPAGDIAGDIAGDLDEWHAVVDALASMPLFDGLPPCELATMAQAFTLSTARPRQLLETQDAQVHRWQMIASGHVVVRRDEVPLGLLTDGDSWSEHSLLNRRRSPISVVALSPTIVLSVDEQNFRALVNAHATFRERIIARSASSADRLALPFLRALMHMEKAALHGTTSPARGRGTEGMPEPE
jgi:CRP-like cAMP-binding protein